MQIETSIAGVRWVQEEGLRTKILPRKEGSRDRVLGVTLGLGLLSLGLVGPQAPWGWIGVVPLVTGLIGTCPLYTLLGLNTCPMKGKTS